MKQLGVFPTIYLILANSIQMTMFEGVPDNKYLTILLNTIYGKNYYDINYV